MKTIEPREECGSGGGGRGSFFGRGKGVEN